MPATVALVDDDENIRELLTEAVAAKTSHTILTAPSGPEAIRMIAQGGITIDGRACKRQ